MLFLAKVAHYMDSQRTLQVADGEEKVIKFSIFWLVRKMVREAHHEAVHKVRNSLKVINYTSIKGYTYVINCFCSFMSKSTVKPVLSGRSKIDKTKV